LYKSNDSANLFSSESIIDVGSERSYKKQINTFLNGTFKNGFKR
jgi:hypothetical protein